MELKPGFERTTAGSIPKGWEVCEVREKGHVLTGKALAAFAPGRQRPYLRTKNVFDGRIDVSDVLTMPMTDEQFAWFEIKPGDVLLNEGQSLELVGRCALYRGEFPGRCAIQNALIRFRAKAGTSPEFAAHLFRHCQRTGVFARVALQTTSIAHLGSTRFETLRLAWPTLQEQRAIAQALGDVDALIEALERLTIKKRDIKQATMQQLLSGQTRLSGFDFEWRMERFDTLFGFSGGYSASRDQLTTGEGFCYLHYGDIHGASKSVVDVKEDYAGIPKLNVPLNRVSSSSLLSDGDVVFVDASEDDDGTSKHVVILNPHGFPFISGLHTIVAKPRGKDLDPFFKRYCFQSQSIKNQFKFYAVGTKVLGISKANIAKLTLHFPPLEEQRAIASILVDMDAELTGLEARLTKTREIKQSMMQHLLTGKLRLVQPQAEELADDRVESETYAGDTLFDPRPFTTSALQRTEGNEDAVMIGVLTRQFGSPQRPLGNVRRAKLTYLTRRHTKTSHDGYLKKAAGPYNPTIRYGGPLELAIDSRFVREVKAQGKSKPYAGLVADEKVGEAMGYFDAWFGSGTRQWLQQFEKVSTDELECLATVDLAMSELRGKGQEITVATVRSFIASEPEWQAKLSRPAFSNSNIGKAMRRSTELFGGAR